MTDSTTLLLALRDRLTRLTEQMRRVPTYTMATVTGTTPLKIRLDGDMTPLAATPSTLVRPPVGARVHVLLANRRAVILGVAGGVADTVPAPGPTRLPIAQYASKQGYTDPNLGANASKNMTVTFPVGLFTNIPIVVASGRSSALIVGIAGYSTTGFTATLWNAWSGGSINPEFSYIATQPD